MIFSSHDEDLKDHVIGSIEEWHKVKKKIKPSLSRLTTLNSDEVEKTIEMMLIFHDVGKMSYRWQDAIVNKKETPPHAQLSAVYLWKYLNLKTHVLREEIRYPMIFATLIHHTGKSFLTDNLERPDVIIIKNGLASDVGNIKWHDEAQEYIDYFSKTIAVESINIETITVDDLRGMARELRRWSLGNELRLNHKNRLIASAFHQVLKICDIRSAQKRKDWDEEKQRPIVEKIIKGGLIP